jgi:hypothetical protein
MAQYLQDHDERGPFPTLWPVLAPDDLLSDWAFVRTWAVTACLGALTWIVLVPMMPKPSSEVRARAREWEVQYSNGERAHLRMSSTGRDGEAS